MAIVEGKFVMRPSNYVHDRYFARGFGTLKKQTLPPVPAELCDLSVQQFVLRSVLLVKLEEKDRARFFNIIRRAKNALDEYEAARTHYEKIFVDEQKSTDAYLRALHHFEVCIAQLVQASELFFGLVGGKYRDKKGNEHERFFERLHEVYNASKHTEHMLVRSQRFEEGDTNSVFIYDEGIASKDHKVTFDELFELICAMADAACIYASGKSPKEE